MVRTFMADNKKTRSDELNNHTTRSNRRAFLKTTGIVAGAGFVAGCMGDGGDGGSGGDGGDGGSGGEDTPAGDGEDTPTEGDDTATDGEDTATEGSPQTDFPQRDISLLIPFGPGGGYDFYSRLLAQHLPEHLPNDVSVQVQNIEGAGGQIATEQVYNAEPDGYTNMIINMVNFALTQLTEDVDYDLREMTMFAQVAAEFRGVAVGSNTDIETWDDYVSAVQNNELNFASTGPGSGYVLVPGVIGDVSGLYPAENVMDNQVIYDGRGAAVQGILAGDAQVMSGSYFSILPYVESGDVRMLMACNTDEQPPEQTPDAETFATAGVDNGQQIQDMLTTRRIFGGTPDIPDAETQVLRNSYSEAIQSDDLQSEAEENDRPIVYANHEEAATAVSNFINSWGERQDLLDTLYGN